MLRPFILNKTSNDFYNQIERYYELLLRHAAEISANRYRVCTFSNDAFLFLSIVGYPPLHYSAMLLCMECNGI